MTRWEYKVIRTDVALLNQLGADGWEAYAATYDTLNNQHLSYLRRPLEAG